MRDIRNPGASEIQLSGNGPALVAPRRYYGAASPEFDLPAERGFGNHYAESTQRFTALGPLRWRYKALGDRRSCLERSGPLGLFRACRRAAGGF